MNRKLVMIGMVVVLGLSCVGLFLALVTHQASASPAIFSYRQVGGDGLGDPGNYQIPSLASFGDYLYAGTWHTNWISKTAQIWRSVDGLHWQKVDERLFDGAATLIAFKGALYAGSWDGHIWYSSDGTSWQEVINKGFGTPEQGIARLMVYGDMLYASLWGGATGTEVWRTSNGTEWTLFIDTGLTNNPDNSAVIASEVFNGYLYLGVVNDGITGAQLWRTNGITTTAVITNGFGITQNLAISSLALFQDMLYAGTYNLDGVQVWRSGNGTGFEKINFAFNNPKTNQENALEVFDGQLYLAVANYSTGVEVWRTSDGVNWERVVNGGFGDTANHNPYWDNGFTVFKDQLYIGITNWQSGGEIWQMRTKPYMTYLPCLTRACLATYYDNFSNPASGWPIDEDNIAKLGYLNGEYQILVKEQGWVVYAYREFMNKDVQIEVDVRPATSLSGSNGLVFSHSTLGYYIFEISENWFTLWKRDSIGQQWIMLIDWTQSPALLKGYQTNRLKVVRAGDSISLYANSQLLATYNDASYHGTELGLASESFTPYFDGRFDNLSVYPGCLPAQTTAQSLSQPPLIQVFELDQGIGSPKP